MARVAPTERLRTRAWALHCHMLYHMEASMFREMVVS
ncbi:MAG: multicopper oxidase domain-containing protein [Burkholderiaceae bacterium]|nr:multicopper oxidase domain-containing protein [Burkholderiaceae bacterium]